MAVKTSVASSTTEDVVGAFSVTAEMEEFFELQKEIVYHVLQVLKVSFTPEEEKRFSKYHTKNLKAVTHFGQGLDALDAGQWKDARDFFKKAVVEDADFELARYYQGATPAATAPPISSLSAMSVGQLAANAATAVDAASASQAGISQGQTAGPEVVRSSAPAPAPAPTTGSITISW
jgi:hypothetical protein